MEAPHGSTPGSACRLGSSAGCSAGPSSTCRRGCAHSIHQCPGCGQWRLSPGPGRKAWVGTGCIFALNLCLVLSSDWRVEWLLPPVRFLSHALRRAPAHAATPPPPTFPPACFSHADCVRELLEAAATPLPANCQGVTALHYAAARGHAAIIRLLLTTPVRLPGGCSVSWAWRLGAVLPCRYRIAGAAAPAEPSTD